MVRRYVAEQTNPVGPEEFNRWVSYRTCVCPVLPLVYGDALFSVSSAPINVAPRLRNLETRQNGDYFILGRGKPQRLQPNDTEPSTWNYPRVISGFEGHLLRL